MFIIFSFSSDTGVESSKKSDEMIVAFCEKIMGRELSLSEKEEYLDRFVFFVRKSAHFILYALLGFSIISFMKEFVLLDYKKMVFCVFLVFLYACSDEIHQLFVMERTGKILDVVIDTFGGVVSTFLYLKIYQVRRKKDEQKKAIS